MLGRVLTPRNIAWLLLLALVAVVYFGEWVEVSRNGGYSADALRNRYLAAEQFLAEFDVAVQASDGLQMIDELPSTNETLLIASSRRGLSERRRDGLVDWVERGGRLILFALDYWDADVDGSGDALLDSLGVRLHQPDGDSVGAIAESAPLPQRVLDRLRNQGSCGKGDRLARIRLVDEPQDVVAAMSTAGYLELVGDYDYAYADNAVGPQLLYIEVGMGAVVALTSLDLWTNQRIHCHDHAHLLRWLTEDRPVLWWLFNTEMPALPVLLWREFPVLVCVALTALFFWLWRTAFRWQRIKPPAGVARRELGEHLDGIARFYWQQGETEQLIAAWRRGFFQGAAVTEDSVDRLASRSKVPADRVRWALTAGVRGDGRRFLGIAKTLHDMDHSDR